jgi:hypothetical protein
MLPGGPYLEVSIKAIERYALPMATTKISLTLESTAAFLAEQAARRDGLSVSAWMSKFIHQNIHQHYPPKPYDGETLAVAELEHQNTVAELASGQGRRAAG